MDDLVKRLEGLPRNSMGWYGIPLAGETYFLPLVVVAEIVSLRATADAARLKRMEDALRPFADACAKADASSEEVRRAGMGNGHSDDASPGWGIRYKHLKDARAALTVGSLPDEIDEFLSTPEDK